MSSTGQHHSKELDIASLLLSPPPCLPYPPRVPYMLIPHAWLPKVDDGPDRVRKRKEVDHAQDCQGRSQGVAWHGGPKED
jgi:hypothetical protein